MTDDQAAPDQRDEDPVAVVEASGRSSPASDAPGPRIVVLDDDPANVLLLSRLLARTGYANVVTRTDPVATTREMLEEPPDLLLLDLRMPELDGYGVLRQLASLLGPPHELPVLVLTADLTTEARYRVLSAGARDFLTKPFDLVELSLRVANLLETVELHRRLREQNEQLEAAVAERTAELVRLSADLAHEVRTPLYAIRGIAEVVLDFEDGVPDGLREDVEQIDAIAVLALDLVDREIAAAREVAGRTLPAPTEVDVGLVLGQLRRVMGPASRSAGVELTVADPPGLPLIFTDGPRLGQILRNLVANALGATGDGAVSVDAQLVDDGARMAFRIRDEGPGVADADRERIFDRFERGAEHGPGGGIGLPIARRLARLLGGDVTLDSGTGSGACFTATVATRLETVGDDGASA